MLPIPFLAPISKGSGIQLPLIFIYGEFGMNKGNCFSELAMEKVLLNKHWEVQIT